jgi:hypothetical protein
MQILLAHTDSLHMRCLLELMLTSGVRVGEALGLTAKTSTSDTPSSASTANSVATELGHRSRPKSRAAYSTSHPGSCGCSECYSSNAAP